VKEHEDTYVVDFNESFSLPNKPFNVILCLGLLRHLNDLSGFFENLSAAQPGKFIIFTYGFRERRPGSRRIQNHIETLEEGLQFFSQYVDGLTVIANVARPQNRFMLCGTLKRGGRQAASAKRRSLGEIICSNTSLAEFVRVQVQKFWTAARRRAYRLAQPARKC